MQPKIKICGLTRADDVRLVHDAGADYFGFIGYRPSPRFIAVEEAAGLASGLPPGRKVYVDVTPGSATLRRAAAAGFDRFQIHFDPATTAAEIKSWSEAVGAGNLWLAPRLGPADPFDEAWLEHADCFLIDSFDPDRIGGTGRAGDWEGFRRLRERYPNKDWILAGGIGPDNLADAIEATGTDRVDVNSGVEAAPGVKDAEKVRRLFALE